MLTNENACSGFVRMVSACQAEVSKHTNLKKIAPGWIRTWSMTVAQMHFTHVNHMTFAA